MWQAYIAAQNTVLDCATTIVNRTRDSLAAECLSFVTNRWLLGRLDHEGTDILVKGKISPNNILFVPILEEDKGTAAYRAFDIGSIGMRANDPEADVFAGAFYRHESRILGAHVGTTTSTALWGIMFLHECFHAWTLATHPELDCEEAHWAHETDAHNFHHNLLVEFFGRPYQNLLDTHVSIMRGLIKKERGKVGENFIVKYDFPPELYKILGEATSINDYKTKGSMFVNHCQFELITRDRFKDRALRQARLLETLFGK